MLNANKLRVSLALVTLAGAFHLNRAEAAAPASVIDCQSYALGYAAGVCATKKLKPAGVTYTCNEDGTANIITISCVEMT
jgi:hypothetical protein